MVKCCSPIQVLIEEQSFAWHSDTLATSSNTKRPQTPERPHYYPNILHCQPQEMADPNSAPDVPQPRCGGQRPQKDNTSNEVKLTSMIRPRVADSSHVRIDQLDEPKHNQSHRPRQDPLLANFHPGPFCAGWERRAAMNHGRLRVVSSLDMKSFRFCWMFGFTSFAYKH